MIATSVKSYAHTVKMLKGSKEEHSVRISHDTAFADMNISDEEEEQKVPSQVSIPIAKTNTKEGRLKSAAPLTFLSDIVNKHPIAAASTEFKIIQKYRETEDLVMRAGVPLV